MQFNNSIKVASEEKLQYIYLCAEFERLILTFELCLNLNAEVAELVDALDSKSSLA